MVGRWHDYTAAVASFIQSKIVFLKNDLSEVSLEHNLIKKICDDNFHGGTIL